MPALIVKLPHDRDFCGEVRLIGDDGAALAGPFKIAGRAVGAAAEEAGNTSRSPLARFGDTPTGRYSIRAILPSGAGTVYRVADYGGSGIIALDPRGGDAALAEANGRFHVFIQGGETVSGRLCATNGALRMRNEDLAILCALLSDAEGVECWCIEDAAMRGADAVMSDNRYDEGDPPPLIKRRPAGRDVSRRRMLAGGAVLATSAISPSLPVLLPGIFIAAESASPALAQGAYDSNNPANSQDNNNQDNNQDQQNNPDNSGQDNNNQDQQNNSDQNNQDNDQNNNGDNSQKAY